MPIAQPSPLPLGGVDPLPKEELAAYLIEARERTLSLVESLSEEQINHQYTPIMSPLAWDLGHIAAFADLWVGRAADDGSALRPDLFEVYDATETPRAGRGDLPYLRCDDALAYGREMLTRALDLLDRVDLSPDGDRLNAGGFVWRMLIEHEHQHNETMLQAMQLAGDMPSPALGGVSVDARAPRPGARASASDGASHRARPASVLVAAGPALVGASASGFAYDNERPRHEVDLPAFEIDREPVSNGAYLAWIEEGGYRRREWWSPAGWEWVGREGAERPLFWTADGRERHFDSTEPLDPELPVTHVCWYEADAFARAHGARLPTELEWEKAAAWDPAAHAKRLHPWGDEPAGDERANLDAQSGRAEPAGARPSGASAYGVLGLIGDLWEWTASELGGYPGFSAFPYREYSEIFFGTGLRILRGGSWATRATIARPTFRNWDLPHRRQLFAGFRCARDVTA